MALSAPVRTLLAEIALNMEAGKSIAVVRDHQELTTQHAANMLGVSRTFFVHLVEEGVMGTLFPF